MIQINGTRPFLQGEVKKSNKGDKCAMERTWWIHSKLNYSGIKEHDGAKECYENYVTNTLIRFLKLQTAQIHNFAVAEMLPVL